REGSNARTSSEFWISITSMPASRNPGAVSGSVTTMNLYTDERLPELFFWYLCDLTAGNNSDIRNLGKFCPDIGNRYGNGERISHELTYCLFYKISFQFFFKGRYLLCGNVFRRDLCDELVGGMLELFQHTFDCPRFHHRKKFFGIKVGAPLHEIPFHLLSIDPITYRTEHSFYVVDINLGDKDILENPRVIGFSGFQLC